jgi:hypothetical protein
VANFNRKRVKMDVKQNGIMLALALGAGLVGGWVSNRSLLGSTAFAQKTPQQETVLHAERVEIAGKDGKRRAWFGLAPKGNVGLGLYDQEGNISAALSVTPERTTGLMLVNKDGQRRAGLVLSAEDEPTLELYDKDKKCRMRLAVAADGEPQVWLYDINQNPRVAVGLSSDGSATLGIADSDRKATIALNVGADGSPSLDLTDQEGKPRATLGYTELRVQSSREIEKQTVASLLLLDPNGQVIGEVRKH